MCLQGSLRARIQADCGQECCRLFPFLHESAHAVVKKTSWDAEVKGVQGGVERTHKGGERLVNLGTKVVMDPAILAPDVGGEPCLALVGAAGHVCVQMGQSMRQVLVQIICLHAPISTFVHQRFVHVLST
jgi:hypothetical protein